VSAEECVSTSKVRFRRLDLNSAEAAGWPDSAPHLGPIRPGLYSFGGLQRQGVDEW
jgi:hypothetical protein